jgi:hypothetical protein
MLLTVVFTVRWITSLVYVALCGVIITLWGLSRTWPGGELPMILL